MLRAIGVAENANLKHRARMEDRYVVQHPLPGSFHDASFLAVYDGHGGREAADYAAETLHKNLMTELQFGTPECCEQALDRAFLTTDNQMKLKVPQSCGTTAVAALITKKTENGPRVLYVANCGDARAILCKDIGSTSVETSRLSIDHKPADPAERARIEQAGGAVINSRVLGVLAVSRALGDHELKSLVSGKPHIHITELPGTPAILILACDGVFDVMTDSECMEFVVAKYTELLAADQSTGDKNAKENPGRDQHMATALARALVQEAIKRSTRDNVTAVVALL